VVGANYASNNAGRAYVYLGGASSLATTPAATLIAPNANGQFGFAVASAGDVTGDGHADVLVGAYQWSSFTGRAYLYLGGTSGLATTPAATLNGPDGPSGFFAYALCGASD
jgi:hypothetical protein